MSNKSDTEITTLAGDISWAIKRLTTNEIGKPVPPLPYSGQENNFVNPYTGKTVSITSSNTPKQTKTRTNRPKQRILAVIGALITACTIYMTKHNNTPIDNENINETIANTSNFDTQLRLLSDFAIQKGILKQEEGLFKSPKLNIPIEDFIEFANIDSNDHIKIYLWNRLGVPVSDILKGISLRNTNMYFDSPEIENTYYASVINEFGETIKNETPLGLQYSKLMEDKLRKMPKDERDNLFTNLIIEYRLKQKANTKGDNHGR